MKNIQLSIIIPVCNVEKYIGPCLESIYRQGLAEDIFEVIIINDGSTDNSLNVISNLMNTHHNISIITNKENAGPSVSRNAGMEKAVGKYVLFVDSDDLLMDNGLSILLQKAVNTSADMIVADYVRMKNEEIGSNYDSLQTDTHDIDKSGLDYYVEDYDPEIGSFIWRILYKRSFLNENHIRLVPGVYYEDIPFLQECYLKAKRVIGVHLLYYIYRIRPRSCTYSFTMKNAMDYNTSIANSWNLLKLENLPKKVRRKIHKNLFLFFNYAVDCIIGVFREPSERKEIILDMKQKVPELSFGGGIKQVYTTFMYRTMPFTYIRCRLFITKVRNWCRARL